MLTSLRCNTKRCKTKYKQEGRWWRCTPCTVRLNQQTHKMTRMSFTHRSGGESTAPTHNHPTLKLRQEPPPEGFVHFLSPDRRPGIYFQFMWNNNFHSNYSPPPPPPPSRWQLVGSGWTWCSSPCPSISQDIVKQHGGSWLVSLVH